MLWFDVPRGKFEWKAACSHTPTELIGTLSGVAWNSNLRSWLKDATVTLRRPHVVSLGVATLQNRPDPDWTAVRLSTLVDLNDRIRELDDPADVAYAAAEFLGRTLKVSRAGYGTIDPEAETIVIERDWNAPGIQSLAGKLHFRDYGTYIDDLKRGETVVFADAEKDPRTAATANALKAISAQSVVNMPIREQGGLVALLYLNHATAREWPTEELALIWDVAERTRSVVERRRVEKQVRQGEERYRSVFENAAVGMLEIDADWSIRTANKAYSKLVDIPTDELMGQNCLAFTHPDDVETSQDALSKAAAGPTGERISFEKRYIRSDESEVWNSKQSRKNRRPRADIAFPKGCRRHQ